MEFDIEDKRVKTVLSLHRGLHGDIQLRANGACIMTFGNGKFHRTKKTNVNGIEYDFSGQIKERIGQL